MKLDLSSMGFRKTPFTRELDISDRFTLDYQSEVAEDIRRTVAQRMSATLVAPAGTGKTVTLRLLASQLPEARYRLHYVKVTGLSKRDLCKEIARACGLDGAGSYPSLVCRLQDHFQDTAGTDGVRVVILLDEAHDLRPDSLAMLRLLTNFEMDSRLVLSLVLAGQPPLKRLLRRPEAEAVAQRMAHAATLRALSRDETRTYMTHRCRVAGVSTLPFDGEALEAIFEMSHGNLRAIDRLALKSLETAVKEKTSTVSSNEVLAARQQLWL